MRFAIITDIHEDYQHLKNVFYAIEKQKCDEIICLGDISGYSIPYYKYHHHRDAHGCLQLIQENCSDVVLGNHDIHSAQIIPGISPHFSYPESWYRMDYFERKKLCDNKIWLHEQDDLNPLYSKADIQFLQKQPQYIVKRLPKCNMLFSHYAYPNISGTSKIFYTYADEFNKHFDFMNLQNCTISFFGHCHKKRPSVITPGKIQRLKQRKYKLNNGPVCITCPPVTRYGNKSRFCIFDTDTFEFKMFKI